MDGTLVGIVVGIAMTVLAVAVNQLMDSRKAHTEQIAALTERVTALEKRKAVIAEAVAAQPKPAGVGGVKMRTWNEDAPIAEEKR